MDVITQAAADHDRLFKELISNFFYEFIDFALPSVSEYLDRDHDAVALDKELFTDVTTGDSHEVDLVMKVRFRNEETNFLVHVENQSRMQTEFPRRMFGYFARLTLKYNLPVYPVVVFSFDRPYRQQPDHYQVVFPDKNVLRFEYSVVQLVRLPWRHFINHTNPVAIALMAKMKIPPKERPKVKAECMRLLANLKLDPARSRLIGGFIESYLKLTAEEMKQYEREVARFTLPERDKTMALISYWEQKGIEQGIELGIERGKEDVLIRQIRRRFGLISDRLVESIESLSSVQLDILAEAFCDFSSVDDLEAWLTQSLSA